LKTSDYNNIYEIIGGAKQRYLVEDEEIDVEDLEEVGKVGARVLIEVLLLLLDKLGQGLNRHKVHLQQEVAPSPLENKKVKNRNNRRQEEKEKRNLSKTEEGLVDELQETPQMLLRLHLVPRSQGLRGHIPIPYIYIRVAT